MSASVATDQWAGNFECTGPCRRKRLMGEAFSKKAMERHLKHGVPLKCKQCTEHAQAQERAAAFKQENNASSPTTTTTDNDNGDNNDKEYRICATCDLSLPESAYNKNQWRNKPQGKARCRDCVEKDLAEAEKEQSSNTQALLLEAQLAVDAAQTPREKLEAESRLSALQAQRVAGLKPVRMGERGSRGGGGKRGVGTSAGRGARAGRSAGGPSSSRSS